MTIALRDALQRTGFWRVLLLNLLPLLPALVLLVTGVVVSHQAAALAKTIGH